MADIRVQDEQGNVHVFPDEATPEMIAKAMGVNPPAAASAAPNPSPIPAGVVNPNPMLQKAGQVGSDLLQGVGEGALSTVHGTGELIRGGLNTLHSGLGDKVVPPVGQTALNQIATPDNTTQKIGKGAEQVGEFMAIPEADFAKLGKAAPIARVLYGAATAGALGKIQGGDFKTNAALGAGGAGLSEAGKAVAPKLAEAALSISPKARMYGRTVGNAVLENTESNSPAKLYPELVNKIGSLTDEVEQRVHAATQQGVKLNIADVKQALQNNIDSLPRNATSVRDRLSSLASNLHLGNPQQTTFSPDELLELKRGIGMEIKSWDRPTQTFAQKAERSIYSLIDKKLDAVAPGTAELNQQISSLIPAKSRAEALSRSASLAQKVSQRALAHTGALTGAAVGGAVGYKEGGTSGALIGGTLGAVAPEVLASPGTEMRAARLANSPLPAKLAVGASSQLAKTLARPKAKLVVSGDSATISPKPSR